MWLWILIAAIIIGAIIGAISSKDGERGEGAVGGAVTTGLGCGYFLFQLLLIGLAIVFVVWLIGFLFG